MGFQWLKATEEQERLKAQTRLEDLRLSDDSLITTTDCAFLSKL